MDRPRLRRWERFGHQVAEIRPSVFEIRTAAGERIGWISMLGTRYEAHGAAQSYFSSEPLGGGPYYSGRAALLRVIAAHDLAQRARELNQRIRELEELERNRQHLPAVYGRGLKKPSRHS